MRKQNNYFTMPNEVFQLGLSAGELAAKRSLPAAQYALGKLYLSDDP